MDKNYLLQQARVSGIVFIDLRIDYAFKLIFGTPGNEDLLLLLVNAILPGRNITSVTLEPQEQVPLRPDARKSVVDVKCTTGDGSTLIIEMQMKSQGDLSDRMVFYSSFPIINRLNRGDNDSYKLTPIYMISITDFIIPGIERNPDMINHYSIRNNKDNGIEFTKSVNFITVELPKLKGNLQELKGKDEWIFYTIRNLGAMKAMPEEYRGSALEKMFELSKFAAMDTISQEEYIARFKAEMDEKSRLKFAREEGIAEGEAKGKAEGIAEERIRMAKRMLADEMDPVMIAKFTGLSVEDISALE